MNPVTIIGAGPAGLMAADVLSQAGVAVDVFDAMPTPARKFLMAGKGGLNLTHSEPLDNFVGRYGVHQAHIEPMLRIFGPDQVREWAHALGCKTFVGTSGRVFPHDMKAAPLLRAWMHRLRSAGVQFHMRHRWLGWSDSDRLGMRFATPEGVIERTANTLILALGGGSWARLGSDGTWLPLLQQRGIELAPLRPANCGFNIDWSEHFRSRYAGHPLKSISIQFINIEGVTRQHRGECVMTEAGIEGSLIYRFSSDLRNAIEAAGSARISIDLMPDWSLDKVTCELLKPRGSRSFSSHLQSRLGLKGAKAALLRECLPEAVLTNPAQLAPHIKALPVHLIGTRPIDEAISTAGGVMFSALNSSLMLNHLPNVYCVGEMLDWEAPTGGYLLTACFASGVTAANGILVGNQVHSTA